MSKTESTPTWKPNPGPQTSVLQQVVKEVLYGGARGGGKTDAGIMRPLRWINNPLLRVLVLRSEYQDLVDRVDRAMQVYSHFGAKKTGNPVLIQFPSGAQIRTGYLKNESYDKYKGHEYQKMIIEELTQIPGEDLYEKLLGSLRSTVDGLDPQIFCTTNPDGIGRLWVKRRFVDVTTPGQPYYTAEGESRVYIPAKVADNPILVEKDPGYVRYLNGIKDDQLRKAWLDGDRDAYDVKGGIYSSQLKQARTENRICTFPHEPHLKVHTVWDLGISDCMAIIFYQKYGKEIRIIDSYYNEGEGLEFYAGVLRSKTTEYGYDYGLHYAPHDIAVRELSTGKTRIDQAKEYGLVFTKVPNVGVRDGINKARELFAYCWFEREKSKTLIEHLEIYRKEFDDKHQAFKPKPFHGPESHFADAFRYLCVSYYAEQKSGVSQTVRERPSLITRQTSQGKMKSSQRSLLYR